MIKFLKDRIFVLLVLLFLSFYISFIVTIGHQIVNSHIVLINKNEFIKINFGLITFIISGFFPYFLWKMLENSDIPILKDTLNARRLGSHIMFMFTICLFISKTIYNYITSTIINIEKSEVLDIKGKLVLIEILSIGIPIMIFLYLTKKVIVNFTNKSKE